MGTNSPAYFHPHWAINKISLLGQTV
jgi:hypothetical protein